MCTLESENHIDKIHCNEKEKFLKTDKFSDIALSNSIMRARLCGVRKSYTMHVQTV